MARLVEARPALGGGPGPTSRRLGGRPRGEGVVASGRFAVSLQRVGGGVRREGLYPAGVGKKEINIRSF